MASLHAEAFDGTAIRSASGLMAYLRQDMGQLRREAFRVLFMDGDNRLLADRTLWTGSVDSVQADPREIARVMLELDAMAIILVHNHPSGRPAPSVSDLSVTKQIVRVCSAVRVVVQDHVIVGRSGCHSMRSSGELAAMEAQVREEASRLRNAA